MINTVKELESGYLLNGVLRVPEDARNRHYKAVQQWIADGNTPEPEFTQAEILQRSIDEANNVAKAELLLLDLASIRVMREYIAELADAPQIIKARETAAAAERAKIK